MSTHEYKILSVYSHKGGVGKTTLVDLIRASVLSTNANPTGLEEKLKFKRCLIVDLDTQMNLTCKILENEDRFQEYFDGLQDVNDFKKNIHNRDIKTKLARLVNYETRYNLNPKPIVILEEAGVRGRRVDLLPGYPELQQMSKQMALELDQPGAPLNNCLALRNLIQAYVDKFHYDLVVLDLGPDLYTINSCALWTSDYVLIPCTADMYSAMSFRLIANTIFPASATDRSHGYNRFNSKLRVLGFLPNRVKMLNDLPTHAHQRGINKLQQKFAEHLGSYFRGVGKFEGSSGTNPCNIMMIGRDIVDNEAQSLLELAVRDQRARVLLSTQLQKMIRWLNLVM